MRFHRGSSCDIRCTKRGNDINHYIRAASKYADQLNSIYIKFAKRLSNGIRTRSKTTGIYAHAMDVIIDSTDYELLHGLSLDKIYAISHARQERIQKNNLNTVLQKLEELQVDSEGRGLVIAYDISCNEITAVDRQLLFYRQYRSLQWPWEDMIKEIDAKAELNYEDEAINVQNII